MTHRGSGRGPHTVEHASHLDAADLAQAVALRRDRLVARQRVPYQADPKRQAEIDMLGEIYRLLRAFDEARQPTSNPASDEETQRLIFEDALAAHRRRPRQSDIGD